MNFTEEMLSLGLVKAVPKLVAERDMPRLTAAQFYALMKATKHPVQDLQDACGNIEINGARVPMMDYAVIEQIVAADPASRLSPFELVLREAGIYTRTCNGIRMAGGTMNLFIDSDVGSALLPTFISKQLQSFSERESTTDGLIAYRDFTPTGSFLQAKIDFSTLDADMKLVSKTAALPEIVIEFAEETTTAKNKGCAVKIPYKLRRAAPIAVLQVALQRIAAARSRAKLVDLISVAYNGVASANSKTKVGWNAGDASPSGEIEYKTWLKFIAKSASGQSYKAVIGDLDSIVAVLLAPKPSADPMTLSAMFDTQRRVIMGEALKMRDQQWSQVELIVDETAPAKSLTALDPRFAISEVIELGSDISESDKNIIGQYWVATVSEASAHAVVDDTSIRVADLT